MLCTRVHEYHVISQCCLTVHPVDRIFTRLKTQKQRDANCKDSKPSCRVTRHIHKSSYARSESLADVADKGIPYKHDENPREKGLITDTTSALLMARDAKLCRVCPAIGCRPPAGSQTILAIEHKEQRKGGQIQPRRRTSGQHRTGAAPSHSQKRRTTPTSVCLFGEPQQASFDHAHPRPGTRSLNHRHLGDNGWRR